MKKIFYTLFFVFVFIPVLMAANWGTTTSLNPYAYGLTSSWDAITQQLTISFTLNAPAVIDETYNDDLGIQIYAVDKETEQKYYMYAVPANDCKTAGTKTYVIDLSDGKGNTDVELPKNTEFTWEVVVHGDNKTLTAPKQLLITKDGVKTGQIRRWRFPTSVAVNNDPNSTDFGSIYVAGNAYYQGTEAREYRGVQKVNPQFENMGWYGIYTGNTNYPLRVRISDDGRVFASSTTTSTATVWEVSNNLNNWTTRISESSQNHGMDVKGSGNDLKLLLYSYKNSKYICNEYAWNGSSFSAATPVSVMHNSTAFGISGASTPHVNIRYDNYYDGYWFIGSRSNNTERQLAHIVEDGTSCDVAYTGSDHFGGAGALSYNDMLVKGHDNGHTEDNPSKLIFYRVSKDANGKVQLTVAYDEAKLVHSTCKGRYVNDFAIDHAYNLYIVSTQNSSVAAGNKSILAETGQLMAFALPYSGHTTTRARDIADYTFSLVCDENIDYQVTLVANDNAMGSASITQGTKLNDGYQSCTDITVAATPNANYRFVNWTIGGKVVSTANPYTFMVTDDITITANFAPAVFDVTWHNLLKSTTDPSNIDVDNTTELWELFMPIYNDYTYEKRNKYTRATQELTTTGLLTWFAVSDENHYTSLYNAMTNDDSPFVWLRDFIISVAGKPTSSGNQNIAKEWVVELVGFFLQTKYTHSSYGLTSADYSGTTDQWTPYYREYVCGLTKTMNYAAEMPISIDSYDPIKNASQIQAAGNDRPYALPTWYVSNDAVANPNQLLAWRLNGTDGKIIHKVDDDMALYATWVDKTISENKDNTDVTLLLGNEKHGSNTHNILVERKFLPTVTDYNTLCLPFSLNSLAGTPYQGATILDFTGTTLQTIGEEVMLVLNFTKVNAIEAGRPYLIQPNSNLGESYTFSNIPYSAVPEPTAKSVAHEHATFHAVLNPGVVTVAADAPTLILVDQNRLAVVSQNGEMKGLRGYFTLSPEMASLALDGRCYLSISKPAPTDVEVLTDPQPKARQQVQKIMRNGQIFIIRDGETYTITGQKVR